MKKVVSIILCLVTIVSIATPAFAVADNSEQWIKENPVYSDTFIDPALEGTTISGDVSAYSYGERHIVSEVFTTYKTVYVTPTGQPSLGYVGGTDAFVFFFESRGRSVEFTITVDTKLFTLNAKTGKVTSSGQGYGAPLPSTIGNYRFDFIKYYVIATRKVDVYGGGDVYQYSYYVHEPEYSLTHRWVRIG